MDGTDAAKDKVCVAVRIRPLSQKEHREGGQSIVDTSGSQLFLAQEKQSPLKYAFDHVLPPETSQMNVFNALGHPLLKKAFDGYNCTIFAYGQTGSGKTYTMLNHKTDDARGIVPRLSEELFLEIGRLQAESPLRKFLVCCSLLEIYNEILYDLLTPNRSKGSVGLEIREQKGLGVYVKDLKEMVVDSCTKLGELIEQGFASRATAATKMNLASSRSHCIITLKLYQRDEEDESNNTFSTMNLVDLAGSERAKDTGAEGDLLKEGANINKSLSALGNVINALSSQASGQKKIFVPYRNSKLTRVLQESLGGNSFCTMLANVSPASINFEETLSTLNYGKRAKVIRVKAIKNEESAQVAKLNDEVDNLRDKLQVQTAQLADAQIDIGIEGRRNLEEKYERQIEELQGFIKQTWQDKQQVSMQYEEERNRLAEEAKRRDEQLLNERRRRLELLEDKGDLMLTLREVQALDRELCGTWADRIVQAQSLDQQLRSQVRALLVYRDSVGHDLALWWNLREETCASQHLHQAAMKLISMLREVEELVGLEREFSDLLTGVVPEVDRAIKCCEEGEDVTLVLALVVRQLDAYRLHIHRFLLSARVEVAIEEDDPSLIVPRLREVLGEDLMLAPLEDATEMLPIPLGLSSLAIGDNAITASSNAAAASCARLLCEEGPYGGWCAGTDDVGEFLEVDIGKRCYISSISTQGRVPATGGWEQTRELLKQVLGTEMLPSGDPLPSSDRVYMRPPVRFVHDVATAVIQRFGVLDGVFSIEQLDYTRLTSKDARHTFFRDLIAGVKAEVGFDALELSALEILGGKNTLESGRLLQLLAYLASQKAAMYAGGLADTRVQWTTRYTIEGNCDTDWRPVCADDGTVDVFEGNSNGTSVKFCSFVPFQAQRVRIRPLEWHNHPALRVELYGSDQLPARACCGLQRRLRQIAAAVDTLKQRAEEMQLAAQSAEEAQRAKQAVEAAQVEQKHAEMERKLQETHREVEALRKAKAAAEEQAIEAETARLQMQVERDRAKARAEQLGADLRREMELRGASEESVAALRRENDSFRDRVADMADQIQVLVDERDTAQLREEDLFEEKIAMEGGLVDTTEGYLTERLLEAEAEVGVLTEQLADERRNSQAMQHRYALGVQGRVSVCLPLPQGAEPVENMHGYDDDFDDESDDGTPQKTPRKRNFSNTLTSSPCATARSLGDSLVVP